MDVRKFGYIRVSSKDQNEGRQLQAMLDNVLKERDIQVFTGWSDRLNQLCGFDDSWIQRWQNQSTNALNLKIQEWKGSYRFFI